MDVMFYEAFAEEQGALEQRLPPSVIAGFTPQTIQETRHKTPPAALISVRTQSVIPPDWGPLLDGILSRTTGFDHLVSYRAASGEDLPCGYLEDYCSRAVAEQAVLFMMVLLRKLPLQQTQFDVFDRNGLTGREAKGRRALVVGVGRIGSEIAGILEALGMEVRGVDIAPKREMTYVSFEEGMAWAEVVFFAVPLTEETRGMLTREILASNEQKPLIINVARGEITPVPVLLRLMQEERLGGVGLDVFSDEAVIAGSLRSPGGYNPVVNEVYQLKMMDNVILTPHNAFNTQEAVARKAEQTVRSLEMFLSERRFVNMV